MPIVTRAQSAGSDSMMSFDVLLSPPSPGFVLLGIEPAAVERPGTVTDLAFSLLSEIDCIDLLPRNFALEFSPYWLFSGENLKYEDYAYSHDISSTFLQTISLSIATSSESGVVPDSLTTSLACGIRFSLLRGNIDPTFNNYANKLDSLYKELAELIGPFHSDIVQSIETDATIKSLDSLFLHSNSVAKPMIKPLIEAQKNQRIAEIKQEVEAKIRGQQTADIENIKQIISRLQLRRIGLKLDVAGGAVTRFPQRMFDDAELNRWGAWVTTGYESRKLSMLGVIRYLDEYSQDNMSNLDVGGRVILDNVDRFSLSTESVYRKFLENDTDDQWRLALIIDYAFANNKIVSFTFGRDFEGGQSGNLIAALNLLGGFGSTRPVR
jgi:hypothetical protein